MKTFGEKLREFREAMGWSQPQLAEHSGVPVGTIRDYEQERRSPLLETAAKLARVLKQPLEAFLPLTDSASEEEPPAPRGRPRKESGQAEAEAPAKGKKRKGK